MRPFAEQQEVPSVPGELELREYGNFDPLLCRVEMPLKALYYPFGFPVEIITNSEEVLKAAEHNWGAFRQMFDERPMELRIGVRESKSEIQLVEPLLRSQGHLFLKIGTMEDFAVGDMRRGFAFCWVGPETAKNHAYLHTHYIEGTVFWLIHSQYLTPIHAACVALDGHGFLFCGDSEAGKSSLAYACARRGWTFVTDDLTELVRNWETNIVLGNPHRFRLRESATAIFPELRRVPVTLRANGERAIELYTANEPGLITAPHARIDLVLFLHRESTGAPLLKPFSKQRALRWFEQVLCMAEDDVREAQASSLRRLLATEILEFRYSDMDSAVAELSSFLRAVDFPRAAKDVAIGQLHG